MALRVDSEQHGRICVRFRPADPRTAQRELVSYDGALRRFITELVSPPPALPSSDRSAQMWAKRFLKWYLTAAALQRESTALGVKIGSLRRCGGLDPAW